MDYIFTEYILLNVLTYFNFIVLIETTFSSIITHIGNNLPIIIKYTIGYCHFYYQIGYGIIFYIYLYRRYKAKKTLNWTSFYGNSTLNWILFNISIFNKFVFNKNFLIYLKSKLNKSYNLVVLFFYSSLEKNVMFLLIKTLISSLKNNITQKVWTPLFKRTSYISFSTFLKRFTKRK